MPIYEFRCRECSVVIEVTQKISDPYPENCPECQSGSLEKLISQTSFHLKGGGWYADNYDGDSNRSGGKSSGKSTPASANGKSSEKKPETKTEKPKESSKPAAKSD